MTDLILGLGYAAMFFSSAANFPQVVKVFRREGSIDDVSLATQVLFMVSSVLWTTYAGLTMQWALLVNSAIVCVCNSVIFGRVLISRSSR